MNGLQLYSSKHKLLSKGLSAEFLKVQIVNGFTVVFRRMMSGIWRGNLPKLFVFQSLLDRTWSMEERKLWGSKRGLLCHT